MPAGWPREPQAVRAEASSSPGPPCSAPRCHSRSAIPRYRPSCPRACNDRGQESGLGCGLPQDPANTRDELKRKQAYRIASICSVSALILCSTLLKSRSISKEYLSTASLSRRIQSTSRACISSLPCSTCVVGSATPPPARSVPRPICSQAQERVSAEGISNVRMLEWRTSPACRA